MKNASKPQSVPDSTIEAVPTRLSISIGGHFGPSYSVDLVDGSLTYGHSKPVQQFPPKWDSGSETIRPTEDQWQTFRKRLDELNVWCWQADYPNPGVCDGTSWSVHIAYADSSIETAGSNCFPGREGNPLSITDYRRDGTFVKFCRAVSHLSGRTFR